VGYIFQLLIVTLICFAIAAPFVVKSNRQRKQFRANDAYRRDYAAWATQQDVADGVVASWEGLRIAKTELIEGYESNAIRHSLVGLTAKVETTGDKTVRNTITKENRLRAVVDDDRRVHVTIEGPRTAIVRSVFTKTSYDADARARQFAAQLNMAGRQLH
jgi:hypothetical protein